MQPAYTIASVVFAGGCVVGVRCGVRFTAATIVIHHLDAHTHPSITRV
jgi:hypothetical protein